MEQSARGTFSLLVREVQNDDGGRYTCEAVNDAGNCQVTVEIIVEGTASDDERLLNNITQRLTTSFNFNYVLILMAL